MIGMCGLASQIGSVTVGCFMTMRTVRGSGVSTRSTPPNSALRKAVELGAATCSSVHFTSSDVTGLPLWNVA